MYSKINFRGNDVYITDLRIKKVDRSPNLFYYDLRHSDEDFSVPCTVEDFVIVNHWGTMISTKDLRRILNNSWGADRICTELEEDEIELFCHALSDGLCVTHEELIK